MWQREATTSMHKLIRISWEISFVLVTVRWVRAVNYTHNHKPYKAWPPAAKIPIWGLPARVWGDRPRQGRQRVVVPRKSWFGTTEHWNICSGCTMHVALAHHTRSKLKTAPSAPSPAPGRMRPRGWCTTHQKPSAAPARHPPSIRDVEP